MAKKGDKKNKAAKKPKIAYVELNELETLSLALRVVVEEKKATASLIQRKLKVSYARAASLLDQLEQLAVITPVRGTEPHSLTGYIPVLKPKPVVVVKETIAKMREQKGKDGELSKPVGRPTKYTPALAEEICRRIAQGESVLKICRVSEHMPTSQTVYSWLLDTDKEDFQKLYTRAREIQAEVFHDELTEIADDSSNDYIETEITEGIIGSQIDHEHINRSRLRVDTRKWIIARMNPRKYGDKVDVTSGGKTIKQPKQAVITYVVPSKPKTK